MAWPNLVLYVRQEGTSTADQMWACEETADGNVVIAGFTLGAWDTSATSDGWIDVVVAKLDVDTGESIWTYQVGLHSIPTESDSM